jgi:hypothetical protein
MEKAGRGMEYLRSLCGLGDDVACTQLQSGFTHLMTSRDQLLVRRVIPLHVRIGTCKDGAYSNAAMKRSAAFRALPILTGLALVQCNLERGYFMVLGCACPFFVL